LIVFPFPFDLLSHFAQNGDGNNHSHNYNYNDPFDGDGFIDASFNVNINVNGDRKKRVWILNLRSGRKGVYDPVRSAFVVTDFVKTILSLRR
jgi:hypothetical protein